MRAYKKLDVHDIFQTHRAGRKVIGLEASLFDLRNRGKKMLSYIYFGGTDDAKLIEKVSRKPEGMRSSI